MTPSVVLMVFPRSVPPGLMPFLHRSPLLWAGSQDEPSFLMIDPEFGSLCAVYGMRHGRRTVRLSLT